MMSNRHKLLSWAGAALIATSLLVLWFSKDENNMPETKSKKIIVTLSGEIFLPLAPENISSIPLYQIHINLWGTLLSSNPREALASISQVSDDGLTYKLRLKPNVRFSNGRAITSEDVLLSFNRILKLQHQGHFNAHAVIENIEALSASDIQIKLRAKTPSFQFLLSIPEMGIVPKEIIQEGKLSECSITSGAYYVVSASNTLLSLKKNPHFVTDSDSSPDDVEIRLYPDSADYVLSALTDKADLIEAHRSFEIAGLHHLDSLKQFTQVATRPSLSVFLILNSDTLERAQRIAVSDLIDQRLQYSPDPKIEKKSYELLPPKTFGALGNNSSPVANKSKSSDLPKSVKIRKTQSDLALAVSKTLEAAGVKIEWLESDSSDQADIRTRLQGMNTEFPEIEYHIMLLSPWSIFKPTNEERSLTLQALQESDPEKRARYIKKISMGILEDARAVPLLVRSYIHAINTDNIVAPQFSDYDGEIRFSRIVMK